MNQQCLFSIETYSSCPLNTIHIPVKGIVVHCNREIFSHLANTERENECDCLFWFSLSLSVRFFLQYLAFILMSSYTWLRFVSLSIRVCCLSLLGILLCNISHSVLAFFSFLFLAKFAPSSWLLSFSLKGLWKPRVYRPCCLQKNQLQIVINLGLLLL